MNYDDIIDAPRHVSEKRPRMSNYDRAAQFSTFAALTGYDGAIRETARLTGEKLELEDGRIQEINQALCWLSAHIEERLEVEISYFRPDERKSGGEYVSVSGRLRRIDGVGGKLVLEGRKEILLEDVLWIGYGAETAGEL